MGEGRGLVKLSESLNTLRLKVRISERWHAGSTFERTAMGNSGGAIKLENHPTKCSQFILQPSIIEIKLFPPPPCSSWEGVSLHFWAFKYSPALCRLGEWPWILICEMNEMQISLFLWNLSLSLSKGRETIKREFDPRVSLGTNPQGKRMLTSS